MIFTNDSTGEKYEEVELGDVSEDDAPRALVIKPLEVKKEIDYDLEYSDLKDGLFWLQLFLRDITKEQSEALREVFEETMRVITEVGGDIREFPPTHLIEITHKARAVFQKDSI